MDNEKLEFDFEITKEDFTFVQQDKKISDKKFDTKPTTFAKDAFKRFCKNKSSVAGAIILGILILLALFVPWISSSNISRTSLDERFLAPKLFASGTGFWDGTIDKTDIVYDTDAGAPADYVAEAVSNLRVDTEPTIVNSASKYGKGGYLAFLNENLYSDYSSADFDYTLFTKDLYFYNTTTFKSTDNAVMTIKFIDELYPETVKAELSGYVLYGEDSRLELFDWTTNRTDITVNISELMQTAGLTEIENARVYLSLKAGNKSMSSVIFNSIVFTTNGDNKEFLENMSFVEGNEMALRYYKDQDKKIFADNYWQCTGQKNAYKVSVYFCSFKYDTYEAAYGYQDVTVSRSTLQSYIDNGWCEYDYEVGPTSFKILDEENCPISEVYDQKLNSRTGKLLEVYTHQYKYRALGYKSMPKFIFGTDAHGYDVFKYAFAGLRTSLILGICTAAFCFLFGLIWGAISGYFGGNVDLIMERFCEILSGIPWIVMMTLFILHLGSNFVTFFLALCLTGWMGTAGRTRTQFYRFKGREYVLASRTLGASDMRLIFKHILPNGMGTIITGAVLMIPSVIFSESTLAYLHLGLTDLASFGVLLANNQQYISVYPNLIVFPAIIMSLMMISFNLFGNGLRDAFNPSLKGGEM